MSFSWNLIMRTTQKFYTRVNQKKNELHHKDNFSISKKLRINHKVILKWIRTRCLAVEYRLGYMQNSVPPPPPQKWSGRTICVYTDGPADRACIGVSGPSGTVCVSTDGPPPS